MSGMLKGNTIKSANNNGVVFPLPNTLKKPLTENKPRIQDNIKKTLPLRRVIIAPPTPITL